MNSTEVASLGRTPRRARRLLNSLLTNKVVTPAGLNWLIASTDPFHDEQLNVEGFPDLSTSKCITQTLTYTTNVSTPNGDSSLWDCHVFFNPNTPPLVYESASGTGLTGVNQAFYRSIINPMGQVSQSGAGLVLCAGTNAIAVANAANWQTASTGTSNQELRLPANFCQGYYRVIGCGIEVTNTTAELYKGGTVTVYRSPAFSSQGSVNSFISSTVTTVTTTSTVTSSVVTEVNGVIKLEVAPEEPMLTTFTLANIPCDFANLPPATQPEAALYPNSRTWGAADGCYIVCTMNCEGNPFTSPVPAKTSGLILGVDNNSLTTTTGNRTAWLPKYGPVNVGTGTFNTPGLCSSIPFDISGAVFSGLNSQTTLQITTRYFVERLPAISDENLLVLARNPCPYDPMVLELYSRCILELPVAVKVGENPLGEWFFDVLQALAAAAPAVGAAFGPVGAAIGTAVGGVGTAALTARKNKQAAKKKG